MKMIVAHHMTRTLLVLCVFGTAAFTGCGGGGGTSSGGQNFDGSYAGTGTATVSGAGQSQRVTGTVSFLIEGTTVTSDPGSRFQGSGTLNGNQLTVTVPGSAFSGGGLTCTGSVVFTGVVGTRQIFDGKISSRNFTCNGVSFTVTGTFTANRVAAQAQSRSGSSFVEQMKDALD